MTVAVTVLCLHSHLESKALEPDFILILNDSLLLAAGISLPCQCPSGHLGTGDLRKPEINMY